MKSAGSYDHQPSGTSFHCQPSTRTVGCCLFCVLQAPPLLATAKAQQTVIHHPPLRLIPSPHIQYLLSDFLLLFSAEGRLQCSLTYHLSFDHSTPPRRRRRSISILDHSKPTADRPHSPVPSTHISLLALVQSLDFIIQITGLSTLCDHFYATKRLI